MSLELIGKGVEACRNNEFEKGIEYFNQALKKDGNQTEVLYHRARALSKIDEMEKSLMDFERLAVIQPTNASFIGDYAVSLHLNNKHEDAKVQFELALNLEPENPYRYSSRAFFKDRIGDHEGAIADYDQAIALDPEDAIALNNRGLVEEKLGYAERAKMSFQKSNDLVGYQPKTAGEIDLKTNKPESSALNSKSDVVKSLLTKEGLKDFGKFTANLLKGSRTKK